MKDNRKLIWLLLTFTIFNLFFIKKAYHIDDPFTLVIAKAIGEHFIRVPQVYQGCPIFMDNVCDNPLLLGYYYAPIIKLLSDREVWLHLFYLPFSILVIVAMYILSNRFIGRGILATLCLCVTPVFIVMSQNIMLDIPLLAFFLGALAAFIYGVDRDDKRLLFLSAILAGLAILTKYSGLLVLLIMLIYALLSSRKRYAYFLFIPLGIFLLWCLHNFIYYRQVYFFTGLLMKGQSLSIEVFIVRTLAVLSFLSGTSICTLFLIPYMLGKKINRWIFISVLPLGMLAFFYKTFTAVPKLNGEIVSLVYGYNGIEKSILGLFFICSSFIIFLVVKVGMLSLTRQPVDKDNLFLSSWFLLLLIFTIALQFIAARFVLLLFPPMFLLMVKELVGGQGQRTVRLARQFVLSSITITIIISVILAIGDYNLAGIYRDFVTSFKKKFSIDQTVYFCPASFDTNLCYGYAYYLRQHYPQAINAKMEVELLDKSGEFIYVVPTGKFFAPPFYQQCADYPETLVYSQKLIGSFNYPGRVFLHNRRFRAGFYSHDWGLLPFNISFKKLPLETFEVYQVRVRRPDQI